MESLLEEKSIEYKNHRIQYLQDLIQTVQEQTSKVQKNLDAAVMQVSNLKMIHNEMVIARKSLCLSDCFKRVNRLRIMVEKLKNKRCAVAGIRHNPCKSVSRFSQCKNCEGKIDPITLCKIETGDGCCANNVCYSKKSLKKMFHHQYDAGMHLHGPTDNAILPEEFVLLFKIGIISEEICTTLQKRYKVGEWRVAKDLSRRFQLERTCSKDETKSNELAVEELL